MTTDDHHDAAASRVRAEHGGAPSRARLIAVVTGAGAGTGRAVAESLALEGHTVFAGVRDSAGRDAARSESLAAFAALRDAGLAPLELDILSDPGCRSAVDAVLAREGRIDLLVTNAGMRTSGIAEGFTPERLARIVETNAVSWLRMHRVVLPAVRRRRSGPWRTSAARPRTSAEPFLGPCAASAAAGKARTDAFGVETVIVVPGACTAGTTHFAHSTGPADAAAVAHYGQLPARADVLPARLAACTAVSVSSSRRTSAPSRPTATSPVDGPGPGGLLISLPTPADAERRAARGVEAQSVAQVSASKRSAPVVREVDAGPCRPRRRGTRQRRVLVQPAVD